MEPIYKILRAVIEVCILRNAAIMFSKASTVALRNPDTKPSWYYDYMYGGRPFPYPQLMLNVSLSSHTAPRSSPRAHGSWSPAAIPPSLQLVSDVTDRNLNSIFNNAD